MKTLYLLFVAALTHSIDAKKDKEIEEVSATDPTEWPTYAPTARVQEVMIIEHVPLLH